MAARQGRLPTCTAFSIGRTATPLPPPPDGVAIRNLPCTIMNGVGKLKKRIKEISLR